MLRKEIVGHFGLTAIWLLVITLLHFGWRLDLIWFWLGGLAGTFLPDLERFFYQKPFWVDSQKPPLRNIIFQLVLLAACFYVVTSSASFFGRGLVLAASLRLLKEAFQQPAKFFWPIKAEFSLYQQKLVIVAMALVFLGLSLLLI